MDSFDELYHPELAQPKIGRPTMYSEELALQLVEYLYEGRGLRWISRQPGMPSPVTITRWKATIPAFSKLYEEARELQLDLMAEDIVEIADALTSADNVPHARLRTDVRRWNLSKLRRHVYGTTVKVEQEVTKAESDLDPTKWTDEQLALYIELQEIAKRDNAE
jgi:hypothetical protein